MAKYFWSNELCYKLARAEIELLEGFIGADLHVQQRAYLRIARPGIREDNLGFHRDTFYGQSPYEVAIHVPLVDLVGQQYDTLVRAEVADLDQRLGRHLPAN